MSIFAWDLAAVRIIEVPIIAGVSARRELNVMAIWSLFKEKKHIIMIK